jgi:hypothetical protein
MERLCQVLFNKNNEHMHEEIFRSERYFVLHDYMASHGQLLLRSDKAKGHVSNIDIIFFDTRFIQLHTWLEGIVIKKAQDRTVLNSALVKEYLDSENANLFEIQTLKGEKYYIAAAFLRVFENKLDFNETSLGLSHPKGRDHEIAASV